MASPSSSPSTPHTWPGRRRLFAAATVLSLTALSLTLLSATGRAQLTGQLILEPIVDDYGTNRTKYQGVDTAIDQLRSGRMVEARETLASVRRTNSNLAPANLMLAQILFGLKQVAAGQLALEEAVREDPTDPGPYAYMGEVARQSRRWAEARLLYQESLALAQNYSANQKRRDRLQVISHNGMAMLADVHQDWATARRHWEQVRELDPTNTIAIMRLGRVMFKMAKSRDEERQVFAIYKELYTNDSNSTAFPDVNMALLYEQSGKTANAKKLMERAMKSDSQNPRTQLAIAKWALDKGEMQIASQATQNALKLNSDAVDGQIYAAMIARSRNELEDAEEALKAAHLLSPTNLAALTKLAQVLAESTDVRKKSLALKYAGLATRLYPDLKDAAGREAAVSMAWVLSRVDQDAAATQAIQQVLSGGGGQISADSGYFAAQILYNSGMTEAAEKILDQAVSGKSSFMNRSAAQQLLAKIRNR